MRPHDEGCVSSIIVNQRPCAQDGPEHTLTGNRLSLMRRNHRDLLSRPAQLFDGSRGIGNFAGLILSTSGKDIDRLGDVVDRGR